MRAHVVSRTAALIVALGVIAGVSARAAAGVGDAPPEPVLAAVDTFGAHHVPAADLIAAAKAAGLTIGMPAGLGDPAFTKALADATARIEATWDLALVQMSPVSYDDSKYGGSTYVTIDVVERGDEARTRFAKAPTGHVADPGGLVAAWIAYEAKAWDLSNRGLLNTTACYGGLHCALGFDHDELRGLERAFIDGAPKHRKELIDLLRHDASGERRGAAAFVLAYAGTAEQVVAALAPSMDDPELLVRNNVIRVLVDVQRHELKPVLALEPLLRALRFPLVTDRNKAAFALEFLIATDPARFRARVLAAVGDDLVAMTALAQPNNHNPAVAILIKLAGEDQGSPEAWRAWLDAQRARASARQR